MNDNLTQLARAERAHGVERVASALSNYLTSVRLQDASVDLGDMFSFQAKVDRHAETLKQRVLKVLDPTTSPQTSLPPPFRPDMNPLELLIHNQLNQHRLGHDLHHAIASAQLRHLAETSPTERFRELTAARAKSLMHKHRRALELNPFLPPDYSAGFLNTPPRL